jgi:hypothetical protein
MMRLRNADCHYADYWYCNADYRNADYCYADYCNADYRYRNAGLELHDMLLTRAA